MVGVMGAWCMRAHWEAGYLSGAIFSYVVKTLTIHMRRGKAYTASKSRPVPRRQAEIDAEAHMDDSCDDAREDVMHLLPKYPSCPGDPLSPVGRGETTEHDAEHLIDDAPLLAGPCKDSLSRATAPSSCDSPPLSPRQHGYHNEDEDDS